MLQSECDFHRKPTMYIQNENFKYDCPSSNVLVSIYTFKILHFAPNTSFSRDVKQLMLTSHNQCYPQCLVSDGILQIIFISSSELIIIYKSIGQIKVSDMFFYSIVCNAFLIMLKWKSII